MGNNDGIIIDGVTFTLGEVGGAFVFSGGGDDYVRLPSNMFPVPTDGVDGNTPFTFELWFRTTASGVILGQQDVEPFELTPGGNVPALYVGTNGQLYASLFWSSGDQLSSPGLVNDGNFHHVAVTYDGANQTLFLDGAALGTIPFVQQGYATNYLYELGTGWTDGWTNTPGGWFPFHGAVDEVSFYDRALIPTEVQSLFLAGSSGKCGGSGPALRHRYSFNGSLEESVVTDSIGGANGAIAFASTTFPFTNGVPDGSAFSGTGTLNLSGTSGYVQLPSHLVSGFSNLTIEAWITWSGPATSVWQRIFDFGFNDAGLNQSGNGTNYLACYTARGGTQLLGFEETTVNPFGTVPDPQGLVLSGPTTVPLGDRLYVAVTYDPIAGSAKLFQNGMLVGSASGTFNRLNRIADFNNWLGRSQWQRDPFFKGSFDEFRIWEGVLTPDEIASHYAGGPDQPIVITRPVLHLDASPGNITLWWSTNNTAAFHLESTLDFRSGWIPITNIVTTVNSRYQVVLPTTASRALFRLKQ